jgi:branched-chain amino acid transport system substrate-binding protein
VKKKIGLSLSLSGEYAAMGRQAETAIGLFVADANAAGGMRIDNAAWELELECHDDASQPERCAEIYRTLCAPRRADIVFGPYSNRLARVAAPIAEQAGRVFVNHGGAGDELYDRGNRLIVGILSPASDYMRPFVQMVSRLMLWRKRMAIVASKSAFARAVASGVESTAGERWPRRRGVRVRVKWNGAFEGESMPPQLFRALMRNRVNVLVSAGSYEHDVAVMRAAVASNLDITVLGCVAAGVHRFGADLGEAAEGIVGPSQWEPSIDTQPRLGPAPAQFARRMRDAGALEAVDYPAAQIYAAGLLTVAAIEAAGSLDDGKVRDAFSNLHTTTLFGDFAIDRVTGRQREHRMVLVQWHRGRKMVIEPTAQANTGSLDIPSGWQLVLAGLEMLRLTRRDDTPQGSDEESDLNDRDEKS